MSDTKPEPKHKIGDILKDTNAVGDCIISDILISPTTGRFAYLVDYNDITGIYSEEDLEPYNDIRFENEEPQ